MQLSIPSEKLSDHRGEATMDPASIRPYYLAPACYRCAWASLLLFPLDCACGGGARRRGGGIGGGIGGRLVIEDRVSVSRCRGRCHQEGLWVLAIKAGFQSCHHGMCHQGFCHQCSVLSRRVPLSRVPSRRVPSRRVRNVAIKASASS